MPSPIRLAAYLPAAVLATAVVIVLPVALTTAIAPAGSPIPTTASVAVTIAVSAAMARVVASLWKRWPYSRDLIFAELMLWNYLRRCWTEWRLRSTQTLYESVKRASPEVSIELLERLSQTLAARDAYTHGHSKRVTRHAVRIARAMGLSPAEVAKVRAAAAVHDVGKLYTPRAILNNPGRLSHEEFEIVKRHPLDGADMLGPAGDRDITAMVRHHHERLDGSGYPDALVGERIPLGARIIAVADTFDAITSHRPYRRASAHKHALDILAKDAGSKLDSAAVAAFHKGYSANRPVAWLAFVLVVPQRLLALLPASSGIGANAGLATQIVPAIGAAGVLALGHGTAHRPAPLAPARAVALATVHRQPLTVATSPGRPMAQGNIRTIRHMSRRGATPALSVPPAPLRQKSGVHNGGTRKTTYVAPSDDGPAQRAGLQQTGSQQTGPEQKGGPSTAPAPPSTNPSPEPTPPPTPTPSPPPISVPEVAGVKVPTVEVSVPPLPSIKS